MNIMYTVVNSRAYDAENFETGLLTWQITAIVIDVILAAGLIVLEIVAIEKIQKEKRRSCKSRFKCRERIISEYLMKK